MQYKEMVQGLALLKVNVLIMQAENEESKQPCAIKSLAIKFVLERVYFLEEFVNNNFKTENNEE